MKLNKISKKTEFIFLAVVIFQIILLVNLSTAESYLISQSNSSGIQNSKTISKKIKKTINSSINLLIGFLDIKQIGMISAQGLYCCPKTEDGAICQDISPFDKESCDNPVPTSCNQVANCKIGCCIDEKEGLCTTNSPWEKCRSDGGVWEDSKACDVRECQKGCCVLGKNTKFETEKSCEKDSAFLGFKKDFRDVETEWECLAIGASQFKGACILQEGACKFATESECLRMNGKFSKDNLCSNPSLGANCTKQKSIGCVEGEDEIYWLDSCGNRENIYSADKTASWNNGRILSKEKSCNPSSDNINSESCGNCNYALSSKCFPSSEAGGKKVKDGNYVCKSLKCTDASGKERSNGESWCEYDGYIGDGKDTVGSRHWKRMCVEGAVKSEPCADYRGQICAQSDIKEGDKSFSISACTMNEAIACLHYNSEKNMKELCNKNKHCMINNVNVDKKFKFDVCVGRYPRGFDLNDPSASSELCAMADQTCTVVYVKDWKGRWKCKQNCNCEKITFAKEMNELCVSLGDCGSYVNYIGQGSDNIKVSRSPKVSWKDYVKYAKPVEGQYAQPQDIDAFISSAIGTSIEGIPPPKESSVDKANKMLGTISGAGGSLIMVAKGLGLTSFLTGTTVTTSTWMSITGTIEGTTTTTITGTSTTPGIMSSTTLAGFSGALTGLTLGLLAGGFLAGKLELTGTGATVMTLAAGVAGAAAGYAYATTGLSALGALSTLVAVVFWVAIAVVVFVAIVGWGKVKERKVTFTCMPWQAPIGGKDCKKCNDDPLKPCSQYRCDSLGSACKLLNEETDNPICEAIPNDGKPPIISLGDITQGYQFKEEAEKKVSVRTVNGDCIPEFTPVLFELKTDEYAQCKFGMEKTNNYDEMEEYPLEKNLFSINHTFAFFMPSLDSMAVYNVSGDLKQMFGNTNMYVRCQDYNGNFNLDEYMVNFCINSGPDLTPANIMIYAPQTGSFLKYSSTESNLSIYLNEPAECKYDKSPGKSYELMMNSMNCKTELSEVGLYGWECNTNLTQLTEDENKIYIKCKDQPWLPPQNKSRNINVEDFIYTLHKSKSELKINSVSPEGEVRQGFEPLSVEIGVKTSGGAEDGNAICYYKWGENWIQFFDTFSSIHKQELILFEGWFEIPIKCEDSAKNTAYGNTEFHLALDYKSPTATRIYYEGNQLILETDEKAECYYDFKRCNFDEKNATSMTTAFSTYHSADWKPGATYYIKCIDIWRNSGCTIEVSPSFIA